MKKVTAPNTIRTSKKHTAFSAKALLDANPFHIAPDEGNMNDNLGGVDTTPMGVVESKFTQSEPPKETTMTDFHPSEADEYVEVDFIAKGNQDEKAAIAQAKIAAKTEKAKAAAAKKEAAANAKAEKAIATAAARDAKALERKAAATLSPEVKAEREAAKLERQARIAELGEGANRTYHGSMLSLADRVKQGAYVKGATGQLRCADDLATMLNAVPVDNVIRLAKIVLELSENPYPNLNMGQQSMNLRNRMRGAITKGTLTLAAIKEAIDENGFETATDWEAIAATKKAEHEERVFAAKAAKEAAALARATAKAEKESVPA